MYQGPPASVDRLPVGAVVSWVTVKVVVAVEPAPLVAVTACVPLAVVLSSQV